MQQPALPNGETVKQPKHTGTIISCVVLSVVWTTLTSMYMPFILRSYKDHVSLRCTSHP